MILRFDFVYSKHKRPGSGERT